MVPIGWLCVHVYLQFECIYKVNDKVYIIFAEQEESIVEFTAILLKLLKELQRDYIDIF